MASLLGGLIASWLFSLVVAAVRRSNRNGKYQAAYFSAAPLIYAGGITIACIGMVAFVVFLDVLGNPTTTWPIYAITSALALVATCGFYDILVRRVDWTETTVRLSKWSGTRIVAWADIMSLEIKADHKYTRIGFRDGSGFAVGELMTGYESFVKAARRRRIKLTESGKAAKH